MQDCYIQYVSLLFVQDNAGKGLRNMWKKTKLYFFKYSGIQQEFIINRKIKLIHSTIGTETTNKKWEKPACSMFMYRCYTYNMVQPNKMLVLISSVANFDFNNYLTLILHRSNKSLTYCRSNNYPWLQISFWDLLHDVFPLNWLCLILS